MKRAIVATLAIAGAVTSSWAEEIELQRIVVTPYRTAVIAEPSDSSTEQIQASEMEKRGVKFLKDVLNLSSSVSTASTGNLGGQTSIFLRGHNANHTRFMIDGIKIYDAMITGAYYNFAHLNLEGFQKIEISKGPQSSLYGSDAIGGVINLFTRKGKGEPSLAFSQKMGSFNTYAESLDFSGEQEKLKYYMGLTRTDSGGYSLAKESNGNTERDPYQNLNAAVRLDYDLSDKTSLGLTGRTIYAKYEYDASSWAPPYLPVDDDDNYAYDHEQIYGATLNQKITDRIDYKLVLSNTNLQRNGWEDAASNNWYEGKTYQADNQLNFTLTDYYKIIAGFDFLREIGDSYRVDGGWVSDFPKAVAQNKGYFIENILNPGKNLLISFSLRRDDHSSFGGQDTFRGAIGYLWDLIKTNFKASYGTGFKAPSLYQLYAPATAFGPIGNPQLQPEESRSFEAGFDNNLIENCKIGVVYFNSAMDNLIDFSNIDGYINVNKSTIQGIESSLNYFFSENLSAGVSYTWLDTENLSNGAELARRPGNKLVFDLKSSFGKLGVNFDVSYVGRRYSDTAGEELLKAYFLGNLSFNYALKETTDLFCRFENIFNTDYEEIRGYQTEPFAVYGGVRLRL
jgi:vitamin B12 transporter